jgi:hypothetical protein
MKLYLLRFLLAKTKPKKLDHQADFATNCIEAIKTQAKKVNGQLFSVLKG